MVSLRPAPSSRPAHLLARRPPSSPVTRGAAVPGAVSRVPSAGPGSRGASLASPGDGRPVPASSAAQSVPLLLPGTASRSSLCAHQCGEGVAAPLWATAGQVTA